MIPPNAYAPLVHGGDLNAARALFPGAPEPFLDLSTGINPNPYPIPALSSETFARLPGVAEVSKLANAAAVAYGAPSERNVAAAAGTQILMSLICARGEIYAREEPGRVAILGPTYAEHARVAALAGHNVSTVSTLDELAGADLAIVVNPNNPDGRLIERERLVALAEVLRQRCGVLVLDEAFMDVEPRTESFASHVAGANVIVLRSFGKFFGLAGLRLGFALADTETAARLRAALGPWPVSGPAIVIGARALSDVTWMEETRRALDEGARRLDELLARAGLEHVGGTSLFRLVRSPDVPRIFERLGHAGIFVRRFDHQPAWLRFGLPGAKDDWRRLERALSA